MKQVSSDYYLKRKYAQLERFIAYFKQIDLILNSNARRILFIGLGDGMVVDYLKKINKDLNITTFDFDQDLNPDTVGDIRHINFENDSFDLVVAFEVLEHIPFEDLEKTLWKLSNISKSLIISLPHRQIGFEFLLKIPFIRTIFKREYFDIKLLLPLNFPGFKVSGQHYWEIDRSTFSLKKVKSVLNKYFNLLKLESTPLDLYRDYFVLEKK